MSLFDQLFSKKNASAARKAPDTMSMPQADATVPMMPYSRRASDAEKLPSAEGISSRKTLRLERRELLYSDIRESMARAGILSASYKFKVLSLDPQGRQYMVMMDLAQEAMVEMARLAEIETQIAQTAKSHHDILVTAVYWRTNDRVSVGLTPAAAPVVNKPPQAPKPAEPSRDEQLAAFKKTFESQNTAPIRSNDTSDFADTVIESPEDDDHPPLSGTQYGELN